eukprot:8217883-Alexandrium_andersonii.AAC.1
MAQNVPNAELARPRTAFRQCSRAVRHCSAGWCLEPPEGAQDRPKRPRSASSVSKQLQPG